VPASHAHIPTDRASRYLTHLCKHSSQMSAITPSHGHGHGDAGAASMPQTTEWSGTDGIIDFGWGRCTLHASDEELLLHAEADDQQHLHRIQDALTTRLQQISHRDQLTISWRQPPPDAESNASPGGIR
jgi:hypothetical protein